jgi:integrase
MKLKSYLKRSIERLRNSEISERNKQIILKFHNECFAEGLSIKRVLKYLCYLPKFARLLKKDFDKANKDDIKQLVAKIEKMECAERTKYDLKVCIKKFYKWLKGDNEIYPPEVRWIKCRIKANKTLPEELLSESEVKKLIETASNLRDKALISTLYEGGFRIGELLAMKIKHVDFTDNIARVTVPKEGKTGVRKILLINSIPYLSNWIAHHPDKNNPNAYLWVCIGTTNHNKLMCYNTVRKLLRNWAEKAGIKKRVNPHSFRHSRATCLANKLTESQLKQYFGWTQGSKMAAVYVHLSGRDVDEAILEMHGLRKPEEKPENQLAPKKCPRCEKLNETTANICFQCGLPLDIKIALDFRKKEKALLSLLSPDILTKFIDQRIREILSQSKVKN